ncbi:TonB-dependent receptor [Pedobacter sandarakinus]|uniref:TonB-dependent receptor n=1 Tax=Pedobacter sandarakinus TaxID=353156 RepID=UPI002247B959|nr:TonB-dependent receptor plug domain-containing protein [Pedobacter sandarakinus]MCX2573415.1 TonB-dependent receptor plug domain-containing protein [Pedobacter sandarakinus]
MKKLLLTVFVIGFSITSFAQVIDTLKRPTITLRSQTNGFMEPLIVIDGKKQPLNGTITIASLNADSISSINVHKGPSAITLYGEDGRNGVIEVTSKKSNLGGLSSKLTPLDTSSLNLSGRVSGLRLSPTQPNHIGQYTKKNLLFKDTDPKAKLIYVVDGVQIEDIKSLNADDIDSVSVIKGENLTGKHQQDADGVVIITTKKIKRKL